MTSSLTVPLVALRVTEYFPAAEYVWTGFCVAEVVPSPKSHFQDVGPPPELSVNLTVKGALPEVVLALKLASTTGTTGFSLIVI
jgi:hypothetical protein